MAGGVRGGGGAAHCSRKEQSKASLGSFACPSPHPPSSRLADNNGSHRHFGNPQVTVKTRTSHEPFAYRSAGTVRFSTCEVGSCF